MVIHFAIYNWKSTVHYENVFCLFLRRILQKVPKQTSIKHLFKLGHGHRNCYLWTAPPCGHFIEQVIFSLHTVKTMKPNFIFDSCIKDKIFNVFLLLQLPYTFFSLQNMKCSMRPNSGLDKVFSSFHNISLQKWWAFFLILWLFSLNYNIIVVKLDIGNCSYQKNKTIVAHLLTGAFKIVIVFMTHTYSVILKFPWYFTYRCTKATWFI